MNPHRCDVPATSRIAQDLPASDFADCYQFDDQWPELSAMDTYLTLVARTPRWMNALMAVRNQIVRLFGLKHLGRLSATSPAKPTRAYQVGDRVGIFSLRHLHEDEVIVWDNDKHLHVQVSVLKHRVNGRPMVSLSTVVHIHNRLGRCYMAIVGPVHSVIVPRMLAQVTRG